MVFPHGWPLLKLRIELVLHDAHKANLLRIVQADAWDNALLMNMLTLSYKDVWQIAQWDQDITNRLDQELVLRIVQPAQSKLTDTSQLTCA